MCSTARKKKVITPANYIRCVDIALNLFTKKIFRTSYLKRSKRCLCRELLLWLWVCFRTTVCQEVNFDLPFVYQPIAKVLLIGLCCHRWSEPIWIRVKTLWQILPQHQSSYLKGTEYTSIEILSSRPKYVNFSKSD